MLHWSEKNNTRVWNTLFLPARSFLKKLLMAKLHAIYVIFVYFDQFYCQISPQCKISIANINKNMMSSLWNPPWRQFTACARDVNARSLSCARDVQARSKMATPIRPARKHCFWIKITMSQYHDIDISNIDIDIGKNAFSMTSLVVSHMINYRETYVWQETTSHDHRGWSNWSYMTGGLWSEVQKYRVLKCLSVVRLSSLWFLVTSFTLYLNNVIILTCNFLIKKKKEKFIWTCND